MVARAFKLKSFQSLDAHFSCYLFCKEEETFTFIRLLNYITIFKYLFVLSIQLDYLGGNKDVGEGDSILRSQF